MQRPLRFILATLFVLVLITLGAAEAVVLRGKLLSTQAQPTETKGVAKAQNPDVLATIDSIAGLSSRESDEMTLMEHTVKEATPFERTNIIRNGQYVGMVAWAESPSVKEEFMALKEALLPAFSVDVTGLTDETIQDPGKPVRNVLQFKDPALGNDAFVFIRVRDRLYEFHIVQGQEATLRPLIEALTTI